MPTIVACPSCGGQLRVADDLLGRKVRCPACSTAFDTTRPPPPPTEKAPGWRDLQLELTDDAPPAPAALKGAIELPAPPGDEPAPDRAPPPRPREEERRTPPARLRGHEDERTCPGCGRGNRDDARRCYHCGERLNDEDRPRRRSYDGFRGPLRRDSEPHRGGLVLTLGIISIVTLAVCWPLAPVGLALGLVAWVMGSADMRKIRNNQMDPTGAGTTQAGWVCGIVGTALNALAFLACGGIFLFIFLEENRRNSYTTTRKYTPPPKAAPKGF